MRVLLIEDDRMLGEGLAEALSRHGFSVDWTRDGMLGEEAARHADHAAILLDLGLPKRDGLDILSDLRRSGIDAPIIILTARDALDDRVNGLNLGADDYLVKPFELAELVARIHAVLRRKAGSAGSRIGTETTSLDIATHELRHGGVDAILSRREFALMRALLERPGQVLSRTQIEESLYGWGEEVESNAVDVLIHYVRRKFGKDVIRNVRGAGWMVAKGR